MRSAVAWLAAVPWAAWAVVRVLGLERGYPAVAIVAFTPYAVVAAAVAAVLALALRRRAAALVALAATVALALCVLPRVRADPGTDRGAAPGPHLRVLAFNARYGLAPAADIAALVERTHADVLTVEELTPALDVALRRALRGTLPARRAISGSGAAGTGMYARRRLAPLPAPATSAAAVAGRLAVPGAPPVELYAIHAAAPYDRGRTAEWADDLRALPPAATPGALRIVAGDFNATLDHAALRRLIATGYEDAADEAGTGLRPTYPSGRALGIAIDHVLADARCGVGEVRTFAVAGSDHRALLAELVLPAA